MNTTVLSFLGLACLLPSAGFATQPTTNRYLFVTNPIVVYRAFPVYHDPHVQQPPRWQPPFRYYPRAPLPGLSHQRFTSPHDARHFHPPAHHHTRPPSRHIDPRLRRD